MSKRFRMMVAIVGLSMATVALAQAPATAPAGSTGLCRDGTYWTGATKKGACRGHKGVQDWYATADTTGGGAASTAAPAAAPAAPAPAAAPTPPPAAPAAAAPSAPSPAPAAQKSMPSPAVNPAPGGGPGQVWVNTSSSVYHCPNDRWYGKTKHGEYMTEADAVAKGDRPDHGKACNK